MDGLPDTSRRPDFDRPPEMRTATEAGGEGARHRSVTRGGAAAAAGLVLSLLGLFGLWLDAVAVHSGAEAAIAVGVVTFAGLLLSLAGWRAARRSGANGRGALVCVLLGAVVLATAVVVLVRA